MEIIKKKNTKCDIKDSSLCKWLNKKECSECYIMEMGDKEQADALQRWEVTQSLLPDNVDELHQSETCHFCVHDPLPKAYYATVDLAHPEPESTKGMFFGLGKKVRTKIGSLLPVSIACCKRCRKAFFMVDFIKFATPVALLIVGILLLLIPPVINALNSLSALASTAFLIVLFLAGILVGKFLSARYIQTKSKEVRFNVFDIPIVGKMEDIGWFLLQDDGEMTRMIFTKNIFNQSRAFKDKND